MKLHIKTLLIVFVFTAASKATPSEVSRPSRGAVVITREQIEADWLRQREVRTTEPVTSGKKVISQQDAAGGFDWFNNVKILVYTQNTKRASVCITKQAA